MQNSASDNVIRSIKGIPENLWNNKIEIGAGVAVSIGLRLAFGAAAVAMLSPVVPAFAVPAALGAGFGAAVGVVREAGWGKAIRDEAWYQRYIRAGIKGAAFGAGSAFVVGWFLDTVVPAQGNTAANTTSTTPTAPTTVATPVPTTAGALASTNAVALTPVEDPSAVIGVNQTTGVATWTHINPNTTCYKPEGFMRWYTETWNLLDKSNKYIKSGITCNGSNGCTTGYYANNVKEFAQFDSKGVPFPECPYNSLDITEPYKQNATGLYNVTRVEGNTASGYVKHIYSVFFNNGTPSCTPLSNQIGYIPMCKAPQP